MGRLMIALVAAVLAAAAATLPAASAEGIAGTWRVIAIGDAAVPAEAGLTLTFESAGTLSGQGGCNRFSGTFELNGASLAIGPLRATQRGCAADVMARENRLMRALGTARHVETRGERGLVLAGAGGDPLVLARS